MPNLLSKILQKNQRGTSPSPSAPVNAIYYPNWSVYRPKPPSSLELDTVTHILYAFVWPNADGSLAFSDSYADHEIAVDGVRGGLAAITQVKQRAPHVKVLLSVGGGGRGSEHFSIMARNQGARDAFVEAVGSLIRTHGFDGVDIDWEHPSNADDKAQYLVLLRQLRNAFPAPDFLLTSALPAPQSLLQHVPLAKAAEELDLLLLMAYDFSGPWTEASGHHAQLFGGPVSGADAVAHLKSKGVPLRKIVLGVPVYGRFFPGAGSVDRPYTKPANEEAATVEFNKLPQRNAMEWVDERAGAAYSVGGDGFTSYDNIRTVTEKAEWAKGQGLAGLFYWTILGDKEGEESLVRAGNRALKS